MTGGDVLGTRLLPPRLPRGACGATILSAESSPGSRGASYAVLAGAGYGKSTLVIQALERAGQPWGWCSCDVRIRDSGLLLAHVADGLARRFPGFGAGLALKGRTEEQVMDLCNETFETMSGMTSCSCSTTRRSSPGRRPPPSASSFRICRQPPTSSWPDAPRSRSRSPGSKRQGRLSSTSAIWPLASTRRALGPLHGRPSRSSSRRGAAQAHRGLGRRTHPRRSQRRTPRRPGTGDLGAFRVPGGGGRFHTAGDAPAFPDRDVAPRPLLASPRRGSHRERRRRGDGAGPRSGSSLHLSAGRRGGVVPLPPAAAGVPAPTFAAVGA